MGPPPATPGSEKSVSFQKSILGPRPKHIIVNKVKIHVASDNEVKQFYKPLTKPGVGFSKTNFRSKTPPPRRVNNNYSRPKTPQPKRHVGRQNQPHGFPICLGVDLEPDEWIKDSGCSKHMTGNRKLFSTYKAYNGGNVIFGSNLRGNIIGKGTISNDSLKIDNVEHVDNLGFNLLSIGQICDNKCRVTFSKHDSEITKDGKVIGRGIRKKGLYVMKLGNKPKDKICLATIDENSTLWHRRLGHANMRLIQSLASKELVRNLPKLKFDQHFCDASKIGKQAHVSHKDKNIVSMTTELRRKPLHLSHRCTIVSIRTNHDREFDNEVQFGEFCNANGITHNFTDPHTPHSNGVVERKNRTLQEVSRTMLNEQSLPEMKPTLDYFRVFGSKCFILNTKDYLSKFDPKSYEGVFLGYSQNSKAYIILNKHTRKIEESLNMTFDETPPPSKTSPLVDDDLDEEEAIREIEKKNLENVVEDETLEIDEIINIKNKLDENGIVSRNKARLVAQGYNQQEGIDYDETYAPVARLESIRILLAYAYALDFKLFQMDVKSAFLDGMVDNTLFTKKKSSNLIIVQIYVDDIIFGSTCQDMCDEFSKIMHDEFEMSMMGKLNFFLGLQIKQMEDDIFFNQSKYIKEMLKKFGLEDSKPMKTSMSFDTKLTKDEEACVFTDRWRLDELAYGIPLDGQYQTNPPSIKDIILSIRIDREGQVRRIHYEEEIDSSAFNQPSLSHLNDDDDDGNDEGTSRYGAWLLEPKSSSGGRGVKEKNLSASNIEVVKDGAVSSVMGDSENAALEVVLPSVVDEDVSKEQQIPVSSYANVTGKPSGKKLNIHTLFTLRGNRIDIVVLVAYPVVANYVRNTWGLGGVRVTAFSKDGLSAITTKLGTPLMLDSYTSDMYMQSCGRSSDARVMIELRSDVELKDNIFVAMPKIIREGHYICNVHVEYEWKPPRFTSCKVFGHIHEVCLKNTGDGEKETLKKPSQTSRGVPIGLKMGFKPQKEYRLVTKKPIVSSSSDKKKGTNRGTTNLVNNEATSSGSPFMNIDNSSTRTTPIIDKIGKFEELLTSGIDTLVDEADNPLKKVKDSYGNGDYDDDLYDDDMYEGRDLPQGLQAICDNLDIRV
ncbi:retrovirus-related pol polyprotein from transposon TNT 1-94 [Tanacetum coccineum]